MLLWIVLFFILIIFGMLICLDKNLNKNESLQIPENYNNLVIDNLAVDNNSLYQQCPCGNGYVCDNGICKKDAGNACVMNSDCSSKLICHNNLCIEKPGIWKSSLNGICKSRLTNTKYNLLCLLPMDKFKLLDDWKNVDDCLSMCEFNVDGETVFIILTKKGLYKIYPDKFVNNREKIYERNNLSSRCTLKDDILNINNKLFLLKKYKLWIAKWNNMDEIKWKKYPLEDLNEYALPNGNKLIKYNNKWIIDETHLKIKIRNTFTNIISPIYNNISFHNDRNNNISIVDNNNNKIMLYDVSRIMQIVKMTSYIYICLNIDKTITKYNLTEKTAEHIDGYGDKLFLCHGRIWLLSNDKCVEIY